MYSLTIEAAYSGTDIKPSERGSYETGNSGTWKNGMSYLRLALKEAEINTEDLPVQMYHKNKETQHPKYDNETPTIMVHVGQINKTSTLHIPTGEEWRQATSVDNDIRYIKRILSSTEETPIDPK